MEQELIKEVVKLLPKITANNEQFNEAELVVIKAAFEAITGINIPPKGMMNCGGKLCEDYKRSIVNYMASYKHVKTEAPKKTTVKKEEPKTIVTLEVSERDILMADALEIAEKNNIKKPHHRAGVDTLKKYIKENG